MSLYANEKNAIIRTLNDCIKNNILVTEFSILNNKIKIFRSFSTGSVSGFINTEYWTGWYGFEEKVDVKKVLQDIYEHFFNNILSSIVFEAKGTLQNLKGKSDNEIKEQLLFDLIDALQPIKGELISIKFNSNKKTFSALFNAGWLAIQQKYVFKENLFNSTTIEIKDKKLSKAVSTLIF